MFRTAIAAATLALLGAASAAQADPSADCVAQATALAATNVTYVGNSWGPTPLYRVTFPNGGTIDFYANDAASAQTAAIPLIENPRSGFPGCQPPADPAPAVATPAAPAYTGPTDQTVNGYDVLYLGTNWGPTPLWRVSFPTLNTTVDVYAGDAQTALANALAVRGPDPTQGQKTTADLLAAQAAPAPAPAPSSPDALAPSTQTAPTPTVTVATVTATSQTVTVGGSTLSSNLTLSAVSKPAKAPAKAIPTAKKKAPPKRPSAVR